jgi:hypothetical protein
MDDDEGRMVIARVLPENIKIYEYLIKISKEKGIMDDEVNTQLFNAGLVAWVERIQLELDIKAEEMKEQE